MALKFRKKIAKKEVNAGKIRKARIIFTPGAILRSTRDSVSFEAMEVETEVQIEVLVSPFRGLGGGGSWR
jgi:hypothetical protein